MITIAFEPIDILLSKCVNMYMDIIHENINSYEHQSLKHFKIGVGNHQSIQACELKVIQQVGM